MLYVVSFIISIFMASLMGHMIGNSYDSKSKECVKSENRHFWFYFCLFLLFTEYFAYLVSTNAPLPR